MRFIIILDLQLLVRLQYLQLQEFWLVSRDHIPLSVGLGTKLGTKNYCSLIPRPWLPSTFDSF